MGNGYNYKFQYQQNPNNFQKSTFLPMLCSSRTSIKDVVALQPRLKERSASFSNDPLSPKIGCTGQVKRNSKNNNKKIIAFPATTTSHNTKLASNSSSNDVKYLKLKRLFSAKNINNNNNSTTFRRRRGGGGGGEVTTEREVCIINIAEMDPPLPVIRKPAADDHEGDDSKNENNLWKRRSNGGALKTLVLQNIQIPRHQLEIQNV